MIFTDPERFFRPPCVGPRGRVGVRIDRRPSWIQVATLVERAYRMVAPPRLRESLDTPRSSRTCRPACVRWRSRASSQGSRRC